MVRVESSSADSIHVAPVGMVVTKTNNAVWIALVGELDLANADQFQADIAELRPDEDLPVHLDLSRLSFCDGYGLGVLLDYQRTSEANGHKVCTHGARHTVRKMAWLLSGGRTDFDEPVDFD